MSSIFPSDQRTSGRETIEARTRRRWPIRPSLLPLEDRKLLSTIVVNNPTDIPVIGEIDLRQAIVEANSSGGDQTITFDEQAFQTPQTITLDPALGQLELSDTTGTETITGPGAGLLSISGNNASRVFFINYASVALSGLTITGGSASTGGGLYNQSGTLSLTNCTVTGSSATNGGGVFTGGVYNYDYGYTYYGTTTLTNCTVSGNSASTGGGVFSSSYGTTTLDNTNVSGNSASNNGGGVETVGYDSTTTLTNCTVSGNTAGNNGGGLANTTGILSSSDGTTTLTNCTLSSNTAGNDGGGLYNRGGTATLTDCTVSRNSAGTFGGGVLSASGRNTTTLTSCTVSGNSATNGAGLVNIDGTTTLTNCTVSGNSAISEGGGLYNNGGGSATLTNCTVAGNSGYGGGLYNSYGGSATLTNTIVAGNLSDADISGGGGYSGTNNLIGGNPQLAPLGNYGGPTQTMALLPGSPAIDAGTSTGAAASDQRGEARLGAVDIGAFESSGFTIAVRSGSGQSTGVLTAFPSSGLVVTVTARNSSEPVAGGLVRFSPPASGASATIGGSPAALSAAGTASVQATANGIAGRYTVVAGTSGVTAPASFSLTNNPLIIALDPSASSALSLSGNARINSPGIVYVDSSSSSALSAGGSARVEAAAIDVHGKVTKSGNSSLSPAPITGAPVLAVASLPSPSTAGMTNRGSLRLAGNSSMTIQPGIYKQISVSGNAKLTMASGVYIVEGGGFSVSGNSSVTGSGVMIVCAGTLYPFHGGSYGSIALSGTGKFSLSPMTRGPYAGIVFLQPGDNKETMTVTASATGITGTIYAPAALLSESGTGSLNASLIVEKLAISGNSVAGPSVLPSTSEAVALFDPTTPAASVGSIPLALKIKVTDASGNSVPSSTLPVVSMSALGSSGKPCAAWNVREGVKELVHYQRSLITTGAMKP